MEISIDSVSAFIYTVRNQRVMLDSDLANLYGVETKALNQAVRRNRSRFPEDFLIEPDSSDLSSLRSQIVTLGKINAGNVVFRHPPYLFTENGVAMLSTVLKSERAIQVNISIIRTFTKLRSFHAMDSSFHGEVVQLKKDTNQLFKIVFERLDGLADQLEPHLDNRRKKIGLKRD